MITNTIKVDQKFIKRAGLLFNASLSDILSELLQNSRRAGATRIDITFTEDIEGNIEDNVINIKDNGVGFFSEGTEINLGGTKWDETTQVKEDPAGCGIFSLAHCETVSIHANNYQVELTPAHFRGDIAYMLHESTMSEGTLISFKYHKLLTAKECVPLCIGASEYLPKDIEVYINDQQVTKRDLFLDVEGIYEWEGLEIGMQLGPRPWSGYPIINFFGLIVRIKDYKNLYVEYLPDGVHPAICSVNFKINVVDCPKLDLVLPQRKELVTNDFYYRLRAKLNSLATNYLLELSDIIDSNLNVPVELTKRKPVINLDMSEYYDTTYVSSSHSFSYREVNAETICLANCSPKSTALLVCHALEQSEYDLENVVLVSEEYVHPLKVVDVEVNLDNYKVILYCPSKTIELDTNILWVPIDDFEGLDDTTIVVNKAKINEQLVRGIINDAFFTFCEDGDCYETQEYNFFNVVDALMPTLMCSTKEEEIEALILANCRSYIPSGYSVSIVKSVEGELTIKATNNNQ